MTGRATLPYDFMLAVRRSNCAAMTWPTAR
jgi:hypothetical protein